MKGKLYSTIKLFAWFVAITFGLIPGKVLAQLPTCDPNVPYYYVNLTGQPAGTWISPPHSRDGYCCSASGSDDCTSFEVILDSTAVALSFNFVSGAVPPGALYYQINCGPPVPVGQPICISGVGPHRVTFCKPGNNQNTYSITSISQPTAPPNDTIRKGCNMNISALGLVTTSVTWNSIYPGAPGQYNSYLSCTSGCDSPNFNPDDNAPEYIHYVVCGNPIADECGYNLNFCDTVIIRTLERLGGTVTPNPASICASGGSVVLNGTAFGGDGNYQFFWKNNTGTTIDNDNSYTATTGGTYTLEIIDGLFGPTCPSALINVPVSTIALPTANAGADQNVCGNAGTVTLTGSVTNSTGSTWIGGNGTFTPSRNSLSATYTPTNTEINSGNLTLILSTTGTGGCAIVKDTMKIIFSPKLVASLPNRTVSCYGESIIFGPTVSGGTPPYSYSWSTGETTATVQQPAGNYCVTITDAQGCAITKCNQVSSPPVLGLSLTKSDVTVVAGNDGSATALVTGGTSPFTYLWSNGQTTSSISGLTSGTYSVSITDANGCPISGSITIVEPSCSSFTISTSSTDPLCTNAGNGTASVLASGGNPPYQYSWSNGQTTPSLTNLSPGVYTIVVTDQTLCQASETIYIVDPPLLGALSSTVDVTIVGSNNGSATLNTSGGTQPYTYSWTNGQTTATATGLTAGTYNYTVTDKNGCSISGTVTINEPDCGNRSVTVAATDATCHFNNDGTAQASMNFGIAPYQYVWSNGQSTPTAGGMVAGTYSVLIIDSVNCQAMSYFTIGEPDLLTHVYTSTDATCADFFNGSINLSVSGGTFPYYYSWSNGVTAEDPTNLFAGTYSFTITDNNGCKSSGSVTISEPQPLEYNYVKTDVKCNGNLTGAIDLTVTGGTQPYLYSWTSGQTTEDLSSIASGYYAVTITDAHGCIIVSSPGLLIDQPDLLTTSTVTVDCPAPGASNADVQVTVDGGKGPYSISFDNGATWGNNGVTNASLPIGTSYTVLVKDSNSCVSPSTYTFVIPTAVVINATTFNPCVTPGSGVNPATADVTGGTGPYQVSWNNGVSFEPSGAYTNSLPINNSYTVVAMDSRGCLSLPFSINLPDSISLSATAVTFASGNNISCNGLTDGSITSVTNGGTPGYTYLWNGPSGFTSSQSAISGLASGTYNLLVKDQNGCTNSVSVTLTQPDVLSATNNASTYNGGYNITCNGASDGTVMTFVSGGSSPFNFNWSGPGGFQASSQNIKDVVAGTYTLTITDVNGCTITTTVKLEEPTDMMAGAITSSYNGFGVACYNGDDGMIDLSAGGGTMPYSFQWIGPNGYTSNSEDLNMVKAGIYSVTITDQNNCTHVFNTSLNEPDPIMLKGSSSPAACGNPVGSIDLIASGGLSPYYYDWSNGSQAEDPGSLAAGIYSVTVTDDNNCSAVHSIAVLPTDNLTADHTTGNATCYQDKDGFIDVTVLTGLPPFTYQWSDGVTTEDRSRLEAGTYMVEITDVMGCKFSGMYTIGQPDQLVLTATPSTFPTGFNVSTANGTDGSISATATGGNEPYQFTWSDGSSGIRLDNLSAGTYTVTCNAGGCLTSLSIELLGPAGLQMPSAFSPNGDGSNETFYVKGLDAYPENHIVVVNRWGNEVFSMDDYMNTWNGTNNDGKELPDGTYFVILEIKGENLVLKGYVDLRR